MARKRKYSFNDDFFKEESEEAFYWAGFIAADGCVRLKKGKYAALQLNISGSDFAHLEKFKNDIGGNFPVHFYTRKQKSKITGKPLTCADISLYSKTIFDDLGEKFNITPRKSKTLKFPEHLANHPLIRHFIRGYFDGDGCFYLKKHITTGQKEQMHSSIRGTIAFLTACKLVLFNSGNVITSVLPYYSNGIGRLDYSGNNMSYYLSKYLYSNACVYLDRKFDLAKQTMEQIPTNKYRKILNKNALNKGEQRNKNEQRLNKNEFIELYKEIGSTKDIAQKIGCNYGTLMNIVNKWGLYEFCKENRKTKLSKADLIDAFVELKMTALVAKRLNRSVGNINKYKRLYGLNHIYM